MDTIDIFSDAECLQIVQKSQRIEHIDDIKLLRYNVKRASGELVGFMGQYLELHVFLEDKNAVNGEQKLRYFVKTIPMFDKLHKAECERKGFFRKETVIYSEILPNIQRYAVSKLYPECYYTRPDLVVLEDLSTPTQGFSQLETIGDYTMEHLQLVFRHLAQLHSASIAWEQHENLNIGERFKDALFELQITMRNEWYATGAKGIIFLAKMHPKLQHAAIQKFIDEKLFNILRNVESLVDTSKKYRNVLCHRDTWNRNIFFKFDEAGHPIESRIVDFQLTRYSPPSIDVLFFLYTTTTTKQRALIYDECLDYYYSSLQSCFERLKLPRDLIPKAQFLESCKMARLAVLVMWAICEPLLKMPEAIRIKLRTEEPVNFDYYMNTKRDELFVRVMEMDADYRDFIMAPIEEMLLYLMENQELYI